MVSDMGLVEWLIDQAADHDGHDMPVTAQRLREAATVIESFVAESVDKTTAWDAIVKKNARLAEINAALSSRDARIVELEAQNAAARQNFHTMQGAANKLRTRAETAEAALSDAVKALEPFAGDKLPGNNRDLIEYDRHGLRRAMSPMEVARRDAFFVLHPDQHPLARSRSKESGE